MSQANYKRFIVKLIGGHPVGFFKGKDRSYGLVAERDATVFLNETEARLRAQQANIRWSQFYIEELPPTEGNEEKKG